MSISFPRALYRISRPSIILKCNNYKLLCKDFLNITFVKIFPKPIMLLEVVVRSGGLVVVLLLNVAEHLLLPLAIGGAGQVL